MQQQEAYPQPLPGERFCPMEDELLYFFLKPMIESGPQHVHGLNKVVFDCDLYGTQEPWEIWDLYKNVRPHDLRLNNDLYFLTKLKKRSTRTKTSQRISRTIGRNGGTWKGNDYGKPVEMVETGVKIGYKKRFTYENKDSEHDGCWIMHEFTLDRSARDNKKAKTENDDYALCLLRRNVEAKAKRGHKNERRIRQRREVEEEDVDVVENNNDACNDGEESNRKQEELHESQTKRQRNETNAWPQEVVIPMMPSWETREDDVMDAVADYYIEETIECDVQDDDSSPTEEVLPITPSSETNEVDDFAAELEESLERDQDDDSSPLDEVVLPMRPSSETNEVDDTDAFAAELEESLECDQDDEASPPSSKDEIAMIGFQDHAGDVEVQQQLGHEVQPACPPLETYACPQEVVQPMRPSLETTEAIDDMNAFAYELEESLECDQDDNASPPNDSKDESARIGFQDHGGDVGGQQQLGHEVQPTCPPMVLEGDHVRYIIE